MAPSRECHPRESGDPEFGAVKLDSRFRGNDKRENKNSPRYIEGCMRIYAALIFVLFALNIIGSRIGVNESYGLFCHTIEGAEVFV
jgi:hypothetical protein